MRVTDVRMKYKPRAECNDEQCPWTAAGDHARTNAKNHVRRTGHEVDVVIEDRTTYWPAEEAP